MSIYDSVIKCSIDELETISIPRNEKVGLEIEYENVKYEFLLNLKDEIDYLVFAGSGSRAKKQQKEQYTEPFYNRWSWEFDQSMIFYNDPTSYIDGELLGGWGVGTAEYWPIEVISLICNLIGKNLNVPKDHFIFYGSSMGGFMSILLATLNRPSYFVADIPQTNFVNHWRWPGFVNKHCFPELTFDEMVEKYGYRLNIFELMKREKYVPKGLMVLDISFEGDVSRHYSFIIDELSKLSLENYHNEFYIRVMAKNNGHAAYRNVQELLDMLIILKNINSIRQGKTINEQFNNSKNILKGSESNMSEKIIDAYQNQINGIQDQISYLKKIIDENEQLKKELEDQREIIDSHQQILNIVLSNNSIKATGFLRKLQLHTLELLKFIVNICEKYDFDYWLDFGSLIGAFRHEGIIPWDDDIDMSMPRKDFEKFVKVLPEEINRFEGLKDKVVIRKGSSVFKNAKLSPDAKYTPIVQFYSIEPFAIMEIYPSEYVNLKEDTPKALQDYRRLFYKARSKLKNDYTNGKCTFEEGYEKGVEQLGISDEPTDYMACSIDGAPRKPIHVSKIYPLRKVSFEGIEMNIPHDPVEYLSYYYNEDVTKIPKKIHHHNTPDVVKKKVKGKDLYKLYHDSLEYWKNINDNF